ncbi:MAG: hypothetical protein JWM68_1147, partial [Verrucomicrobiales bacterium]|nr:hypothetical protein [Verrucomicrobiales bacterium]
MSHLILYRSGTIHFPGWVIFLLLAFVSNGNAIDNKQSNQPSSPSVLQCTVYPTEPAGITKTSKSIATTNNGVIVLSNQWISIEISATTGVITGIRHGLTSEHYPIRGDETGCSFANARGQTIQWFARDGEMHAFEVKVSPHEQDGCSAVLTTHASDGSIVTLSYTLNDSQFWVERRFAIDGGEAEYDELHYGKAEVPGGATKELKLGKFDAPRLVSSGRGGVFFGVGWWYYEVKDGVYQNAKMHYRTARRLEAEPWYIGVLRPEAGEPYAGWLWYKTFLQERKLAYDKQRSYFLWNTRSGYDFVPIDDPALLQHVLVTTQLGLNGLTAGIVRGLQNATDLASTNPLARKNLGAYARNSLTFGLHEGNVAATNWRTDATLAKKLKEIDDAAKQGFGNLTIDFFGVKDTFDEHRRVAEFFRYVRNRMSYSECHLGMAAYGPQFQREVLINHPTDLKGFDIGRFSSDWATLLGFRHSRRQWQQKYDYLMPENGLFYFCTHYSHYPRQYLDPEPQQFLQTTDARRGLSFAFHDKFGFRDSIAAQSAFSTFYVFSFLDPHTPPQDMAFGRDYLKWVKSNIDVLNRSRVCMETEDALVMSKIRDGRGALFAVNYRPGEKLFKLKFDLPGAKQIEVQQVYPVHGKPMPLPANGELEVAVPGERLAIFNINHGLNGLPPENRRDFPIDVSDWQHNGDSFTGRFIMPDIRKELAQQKDAALPQRIVSVEQSDTLTLADRKAHQLGGKLPPPFIDLFGFTDGKFIPTWKAVPWAFADRV